MKKININKNLPPIGKKVTFIVVDSGRETEGYFRKAQQNSAALGYFTEINSNNEYTIWNETSLRKNEVEIWFKTIEGNNKNLFTILILIFIIFQSCVNNNRKISTISYKVEVDIKKYKKIYTIAYGDERFDDCEDLVNVTYGITFKGDTIELNTELRKCWYKKSSFNFKKEGP